jgi:AGZA family xanthine/uracil permease-like MFS transporter
VQTLRCLANGFLVTSLLWASALAEMLDGRLIRSAGYLSIAALCALFGIIHSPLPDAPIGLPQDVLQRLSGEAARFQTPYHWTAAYLLAAGLLLGLGCCQPKRGLEKDPVSS